MCRAGHFYTILGFIPIKERSTLSQNSDIWRGPILDKEQASNIDAAFNITGGHIIWSIGDLKLADILQ